MLPQFLEENSKESLFYIKDSHDEIRWIFSRNQQRPAFLNLYNTNSLKGVFYKNAVRIAFRYGLKKHIASGAINCTLNKKYSNHLQSLRCKGFSIFTGTPGENRKIIVEFNDGFTTKFFLKIPLGATSFSLVKNEKLFLKKIAGLNLERVAIPSIVHHDKECLITTNVKPEKSLKYNKFKEVHSQALLEIILKTKREVSFEDWTFFEEIANNISLCSTITNSNFDNMDELLDKVKKIYNIYDTNKKILVSLAHGDFTPWNLYATKQKLHLYDLEMTKDNAPLFFDLFHFVFQTEILVRRGSYKDIKETLKIIFGTKNIKSFVNENNIDVLKYRSLYVLYIVSYYLPKYAIQKDLHIQAIWLVNIWEDALNDLIDNDEN